MSEDERKLLIEWMERTQVVLTEVCCNPIPMDFHNQLSRMKEITRIINTRPHDASEGGD